MSRAGTFRGAVLRAAAAAVAVGAAVYLSPALVRPAHADGFGPTCTAECPKGKCTGEATNCVCSCHWLYQTPICNCNGPDHEPTP